MKLSDKKRLVGETGGDMRSINRWADGDSVRPVTAYAYAVACRKLGIPVPQKATVPGGAVAHGEDHG